MVNSVTDSLPMLMVKKRECSKKRKQKSMIPMHQQMMLDHKEVVVYVQDLPQSRIYVHKMLGS
eukprot:2588685-Ditylum_brightwellii.AAC.1